jgi:hypothetical protein
VFECQAQSIEDAPAEVGHCLRGPVRLDLTYSCMRAYSSSGPCVVASADCTPLARDPSTVQALAWCEVEFCVLGSCE